ncbi:hypothetical protein OEZ86_002502 [Tetradesmus obliquus]|nr:hypothetical protein OEZ86_002502 [Tetradesmus obliquus]
MDDHGEIAELMQLAKLGRGKQQQQQQHADPDSDDGAAAAASQDARSDDNDSYDDAYDDCVVEEQQLLKHALTQISELKQIAPFTFEIKQGSTRGMAVPARFFASPLLLDMVVREAQASGGGGGGGFTASLQQLANVATLPGIVGASIGMPDLHSGYGFAIGNVCAVDMEGGSGVVSPGGVGFDINCGVRLLRSSLNIEDLFPVRDKLADVLFKAVPVGVGSEGSLRLGAADMDKLLTGGMAWLEEKGMCWPEDREVTEEHGCFPGADASKVSPCAKARGAAQCGTLGSGNHYVEVQVVDEVFDAEAASVMGLGKKGTVCIMIHSGSRGLGHQVCTDYLSAADRAMAKAGLRLVDRQLAAAPLSSSEGRHYLAAMAAAANFAFANRSLMAAQVRGAFQEVFKSSPAKLGLHQVYDVSHNIAKKELHTLPDGSQRQLLVHRKGATRAFPPGHAELPAAYRGIGQPVLIGGSMGTASYVMTGTQGAMQRSFGSTCHGAGRALSHSAAMRGLDSKQVLSQLSQQGIALRIATKKLAAEEAPASYKDVSQVIDTCHAVGISKKCVRLRPVIVVKG